MFNISKSPCSFYFENTKIRELYRCMIQLNQDVLMKKKSLSKSEMSFSQNPAEKFLLNCLKDIKAHSSQECSDFYKSIMLSSQQENWTARMIASTAINVLLHIKDEEFSNEDREYFFGKSTAQNRF